MFASTFDNFTSLLPPYHDAIPVISQEIGDTWIYGTPSDPVKHATMRAMMRGWARYLEEGGARDSVYLNASRLLVKSVEHTWGDHVHLEEWQNGSSWMNAQFEKDRHSTAGTSCMADKNWPVQPSRIPPLCILITRAGIEWRRCHHAVCMAQPCEPHHSGQAEP